MQGNGLFRSSEYLLVLYFALAAARTAARGLFAFGLVDLCVPLVFAALALMERRVRRVWVGVLRDWTAMPFLLLAYWNVDWITQVPQTGGYEQRWIRLDRLLLYGWGGRSAIECCGVLLPSLLELSYLVLYAVPPVLLGIIYLAGRRRQADRFLFTLFAGSLAAYALLPLFPSASPRDLFPGQDLPSMTTVFRRINLWLLDSFDIHTSVFPSGHVAVAFCSAFGVMRVLPERRWLGRALLAFAALVTINTVYARYHYAVDGLAALAISLVAFHFSRLLDHWRPD
ncbi:MAG: phosphatase PAP2 family protein [Acidobacteria bacterium]|nr:phosphatase PAP2 family protein [Acidobacteriota bacterium]